MSVSDTKSCELDLELVTATSKTPIFRVGGSDKGVCRLSSDEYTSSYGFTCRPVSVASVGYNTSPVKSWAANITTK